MQLPWFADYFGQPDNPAYIPDILLGYSDKMNFFERTEHFLVLLYRKLFYEFRIRRPGIEYSKKFIGEDPEKAWENMNMMLVNAHFTSHRPKPLVPGWIDVAGLHIEEAKPIPKVIKA